MAKHSLRDVPGRVKFRVIEFELDGSDVALQDAIKGLSTALAGNRTQTQVKRIASGNGAHAPAAVEEPLDPEDGEETTEEAASEETEAARPRTPRASGKPRA